MKNNFEKIKNELRQLIISKQALCNTEKEKNQAVNEARAEINKKYGKGWREKYQSYDDWWQQCNLDGSFAYNGVTDDF